MVSPSPEHHDDVAPSDLLTARRVGVALALMLLAALVVLGVPAASADSTGSDRAGASASADDGDDDDRDDHDDEDGDGSDELDPNTLDVDGALDEVWWTVQETGLAKDVAYAFGMRTGTLIELNPELSREDEIAAGTRLRVFQRVEGKPTRSIEHPDDGTLRRGVPLPEGDAWHSPSRRFQYGTQLTVVTLLDVFETYADEYPDAPKLVVGDLSRRKGGEIERKHDSHQSGRDVDIGYPRTDNPEIEGTDLPPVSAETLDVEKTWFLLETLLATGQVQVVFMDKEVQTLLDEHVGDRFTKEERAMLFEHPRRVHSHRALVQHWDHHDDHMHVRFVCEPHNWRCRGNGVWGQ